MKPLLRTSFRTTIQRMLILGVIGGLLALAAGPVAAQSGGYDLSWSTVDGGGGESAAGDFRVVGSAGQPDAGSVSGGARRLGGGFWGGGAASEAHRIYLPLVLR